MKVKRINLRFFDAKEALKKFAAKLSATRKGRPLAKEELLSFSTINVFRKIITEKRLELLHVIKQKTPGSVYELAKEVDRDLKSVNTDLSILKELGLVSLEETKEERIKTKPTVDFDKINVEIEI